MSKIDELEETFKREIDENKKLDIWD